MELKGRLAISYFKPKRFEYYQDKAVYDLLGIRIYKRFLPSTGDIVRRWWRIRQLEIGKSGRANELYRYELKTRNYEYRHLLGLALFVVLTLSIDRSFTFFDWTFLAILNLVVNIYPIFLQRYNRIRILNVMQRAGLINPYKK